MTYTSRETGEILRPMRWRLLLISGQSVTIEAMTMATSGHGITFKNIDKEITLSLSSHIVLLIEREGHHIGLTDQDLVAAWDKERNQPSPSEASG